MADRTAEEMRERVLLWEQGIRADSALYSRITRGVAENEQILRLIQVAPPGQLEMNLLLAAVQYLLIADPRHPLAGWYPSLGGTNIDGDVLAEFVPFVLTNLETIAELISTRRVQTNEVARCAFLLPAYNLVGRLSGRPLAVIEIGTSAGLTQNLDRYGYRFVADDATVELSPASPVQLTSNTGKTVPYPAQSIPTIVWRAGLDLHPVNINDDDQVRWLRALLWPDRVDRHRRLEAAIALARQHPPTVIAGDAIADVAGLVTAAPPDTAVVIQHSYVLNQMARADRERFMDLLDGLGTTRGIYRVGAESLRRPPRTTLEMTLHGPTRETRMLADVHHHGAWIRWERE
jgi:hypothetical protein